MNHKELSAQVMAVVVDGGVAMNTILNRISQNCREEF